MSNIAFKNGDYIQQKNVLTYHLRLSEFLNPQNRAILIGEQNSYNNFNPLMVNDNQQITDENYTNSSQYIVNNKVIINNNSNEYYSVDKAESIIGSTNASMTDGYITQQLNIIANQMPLVYQLDESEYYYEIIKTNKYENQDVYEYISKKYTFKYPQGKNFNFLVAFAYNSPTSAPYLKDTFTYLYTVEEKDKDIELYYRYHNDGINAAINEDSPKIPTVYKAYWI